MGILILNFVTEILGFIDFLKFTQLLEWKGQDSKPGFSDGTICVLFIVTLGAGNSASLKEILDLEATRMRLCLVRMTLCDSILKLPHGLPWHSPGWVGFIDSFHFSIGKRLKGHPAPLPGDHLARAGCCLGSLEASSAFFLGTAQTYRKFFIFCHNKLQNKPNPSSA